MKINFKTLYNLAVYPPHVTKGGLPRASGSKNTHFWSSDDKKNRRHFSVSSHLYTTNDNLIDKNNFTYINNPTITNTHRKKRALITFPDMYDLKRFINKAQYYD